MVDDDKYLLLDVHVRNSHNFVIPKYLANSCAIWLQMLDAQSRLPSVNIPIVSCSRLTLAEADFQQQSIHHHNNFKLNSSEAPMNFVI